MGRYDIDQGVYELGKLIVQLLAYICRKIGAAFQYAFHIRIIAFFRKHMSQRRMQLGEVLAAEAQELKFMLVVV